MKTRTSSFLFSLALLLASAPAAWGGDDPSIVEPLRSQVQQSMIDHITGHSVDGEFWHYDPVAGELLQLTLKELHSGIVHKGDYLVSCADFESSDGRVFDLDFLVVATEDGAKTLQSIVHAVDHEKRPYQLESD